jgi:hypothetical protein
MAVVYDFDRLHENTTDSYNASAHAAGFEFRFNESQILETIWCYIQGRDGFEPIDPAVVGVPLYRTFEAARSAAKELGMTAKEAPNGAAWIRFDVDGLRHHYEFSSGQLALVTLMRPQA